MILPNIYCVASGAVMRCISILNSEGKRLPNVIEIGCADGQGTMRYAGFCGKVLCIDPMVEGRPDIGLGISRDDLKVDQAKVDNFIRRTDELPVKLFIGCSAWPETVDCVKQFLRDLVEGEQVDILLIDGCHHPFEAVMADFDLYYPLVKKGGLVVFDDLYEDDCLRAYARAIDLHSMEEVDRFFLPPDRLQATGILRKTRD